MTGKLTCKTTPPGATIYYDGKKQAYKTPITFTGCSPGVKTIKYELIGYESATDRVEVFDDRTSYSTATLKTIAPPPEEKGKIRCVTTPPGADIYFNGRKQANVTPTTLTGVTPNKFHTIKFTKSDFLDASDQWLVKPRQTIVAEKILIPVTQPGYINAISDLPGVTVKMIIEGKTYSYPAPHKFGAPAGRNVVFFSKPGHKQVEHSITVEPRQTVTLKGNPIPIVAETILTLNTLPKSTTEGDKVTLSGTLKTKDGKPLFGTIKFYDQDIGLDAPLTANDKPIVTTSDRTTGKFSITWTAISMDKPLKRANIIAKFEGTKTHNKSESEVQTIKIESKIEKGFIDVSSQPPNADVYMDGKKMLGKTPMHLSPEEIGKHKIKIVFGEFEPYEEDVEVEAGKTADVRHTFIAPSNLCSILGFDATAAECSRAIFTLGVDLLTPIADAHIIMNHTSPYTGKPEEPTKMTYAFFLLGCIPVAGPVGKTIGKVGLKVTAKGAKLANLAKADSRIASIFMEENIIGKILSMTATEVDKFIDLVLRKNYDGIRAMLKDTKAEALPTDKIDEIVDNAKTIIPNEDALKRMEDILTIEKVVPEKFMFWTDWLTSILKADKTFVSHDEAAKILKDAMEDPSLFRKIADELDLSGITARLEAIDSNESLGVYSLMRWISKIDTRLPIEQQNKLVSEMAETALATLEKTPNFSKELPKALDEIDDISSRVYPFTSAVRAAGLDEPFNLVDEITIFLRSIRTTPYTSRPKATVTFAKAILNGMHRFMKDNPKFAMATTITGLSMAAWALYEISSFFGAYLIPKYLGLGPGDRTFRANELSDTLTGMFFTCDAACKTGNLDSLKTCTDNFSLTLTNFEDYVEEHREALEREQTLDVAEGNILLHHMNLDRLLECLPPEIIIPESGLIENVFVKKIIDGDTVECSTEKFPSFRVRTAGINTPEKKPMGLDFYPVSCTTTSGAEPHTIECTKDMWYAANGQFWKLIDDKTVTLKIRSDRPKDDYGRYIAAIITSDETEINIEMLKSGNACYYHRADFGPTEGDIINHDAYVAARDEAKAAGLGIWASEELESDIGSAIFKAFRLTEEDKPIGLTAEIWLGDDFLYNSSTTKERDWSVGSHEVIFKAMGYVDNPVKFTIEKNKPIVVDATLIPTKAIVDEGYTILRTYRMSTTGSLVAITSDVYEDGIYLFRTSASTLRAFSPGKHTVVFKNINYKDKSSTFTIETDKTITVNETLVELPEDETEDLDEPDEPFGLVDFISTPSVAKIFVNGSYIGTTKKSGFKLAEGPYSIMFEKGGYEPCTKPLTVIADERFPVECVLIESLLPPADPSYPDLPYFPSTPSRRRLPPSTYEITPIPTLPPAAPEPEAEPWEEFKAPMKVLFLNIGKEVTKQTSIATAGQKFIDKHCDLDFEWESEDHDMVELGMDDNDCATLDDTEELTETIERDITPDNTKIIYLLWNADEPKCVSYTGFTGDIEDLLFDAMLCSSPTTKSKPEFTATTGKLKNDNLEIAYEGSLTIIIQICEALHELYEKTKSDDAPELPEFDEEFCKKNITEDRPNAKCVVEWLSKFNDALPKEL